MNAKSRLLFKVTDRFLIRGRGVIVIPGFAVTESDRVRIGDPISLKRPDGVELPWTIGGIPMVIENRKPYEPSGELPILLKGLEKEDVPVGTEIWTREEAQR